MHEEKNSVQSIIFFEEFDYLAVFKVYREEIIKFINNNNQVDAGDVVIYLLKKAETLLKKAVLLEAVEYGKIYLTLWDKAITTLRKKLLLVSGVKTYRNKKIEIGDKVFVDLLSSYHELLKQEIENTPNQALVKRLQEQNTTTLNLLSNLKTVNQDFLKATWKKISKYLLTFFDEKTLISLRDGHIEIRKKAHDHYCQLLNALRSQLFLENKGWKSEWLYGKNPFGLKSFKFNGKSGVTVDTFFHLSQDIKSEQRFMIIENMMSDISNLMGSTYFSMDKPFDKEKSLCLNANYQSGTAGATTDGLGHFPSEEDNRRVQTAAYRAAKLLVRYANFYQDSNALYEVLPMLFAHVGKAVKYGFLSPQNTGTATCVLTKVFKDRVIAGGIGDCMVIAWTPSTSELTVLIKPRRYSREFQCSPISITEKMPEEAFQRCSVVLSPDSFLMRMSDGAWELLPYVTTNGFDEKYNKRYLEYTIDNKLEIQLGNFAIQNPKAHAAEYRDFLQSLMKENLKIQKTLLYEYYNAVHEKLKIFPATETATLGDFISWAQEMDKDFHKLILEGIKQSDYNIDNIKIMLFKEFVLMLDRISIGDDITLHVEALGKEELSNKCTFIL